VGFVVDRWALGQGFYKYLGFLLSVSFHLCFKLIRSAVTDAVTASLSNTCTHIGLVISPVVLFIFNTDTDNTHNANNERYFILKIT
jgi:hypothetical protein